jgi:glutaredoxin-like protein
MSLIPDDHKEHIRSQLAESLVNPVRILMFTQEMECRFCAETKQLLMELAALSDKIQVEVHDYVADSALANQYGIDKIPAVVIMREKDYGIRFYGLPFGYEFQTFLNGLTGVSKGTSNLSEEIRQTLLEIKTPVNIKVFVTLTCPHCPVAASMAHRFAMDNDMIRAEVIDASEFPQLALKYSVVGVPKTIINEKVEFVGVVSESIFLEHLKLAVQKTLQTPQ